TAQRVGVDVGGFGFDGSMMGKHLHVIRILRVRTALRAHASADRIGVYRNLRIARLYIGPYRSPATSLSCTSCFPFGHGRSSQAAGRGFRTTRAHGSAGPTGLIRHAASSPAPRATRAALPAHRPARGTPAGTASGSPPTPACPAPGPDAPAPAVRTTAAPRPRSAAPSAWPPSGSSRGSSPARVRVGGRPASSTQAATSTPHLANIALIASGLTNSP